MESRVKLKSTIPAQLPQYIQEDHPVFQSFIEAYFEYIEQTNGPISFVRDALRYIDPSETMDEFISKFFEEMRDIPNDILADKSLLVQHIIELYQAKGTIKGYELLFRILYGESISIHLPKSDLLKPSDGKWERNLVIRVTQLAGDPFYCIGKEVYQTNSIGTKTARTRIENVIYRSDIDAYDLYIGQNTTIGTFVEGNIECDDVTMVLSMSPVLYTKQSRGSGYEANDIVNSYEGEETLAIVSDVRGGPITQVIILDGGYGYSVGDQIPVTSDVGEGADIRVAEVYNGAVSRVQIISGGQGYFKFFTADTSGRGVFVLVGDSIGAINSFKIRDPGINHTTPPECSVDTRCVIADIDGSFIAGEPLEFLPDNLISEAYTDLLLEDGSRLLGESDDTSTYTYFFKSSSNNIAVLSGYFGEVEFALEDDVGLLKLETGDIIVGESSNFIPRMKTMRGLESGATARIVYINPVDIDSDLTAIYDTGARFVSEDGMISEATKRIQDSRYYQEFSYVIRSGQSFKTYQSAISKLMHPAGMVAFGAVDVVTKSKIVINTVNTVANIVAKIIEIYINQQVKYSGEFDLAITPAAQLNVYRDYAWLEKNKFYFGPREYGTIGAVNGGITQMRDIPSVENINSNYNTPIAHFSNIAFTDLYVYDGSDYLLKRTKLPYTWEAEIDIITSLITSDDLIFITADDQYFGPADSV